MNRFHTISQLGTVKENAINFRIMRPKSKGKMRIIHSLTMGEIFCKLNDKEMEQRRGETEDRKGKGRKS